MFSTGDTIVAIATPPGRGGIGVVRMSGAEATRLARGLIHREESLAPRYATLTTVRSAGDAALDRVIVTYFPAPASYTGEDVVEISAHGSPVVLTAIVSAAVGAGARLAEPGEFTLRAFLNGRIDLTQAEAVGDLIDAATPQQARAAFDQLQGTLTETIAAIDGQLFDLIARLEASVDFPGEGYHFVEPGALAAAIEAVIVRTGQLLATARRGRLLREGLQIAIVGRPNVGKSSLFNALVGSARAIVTEVPGTTRDLVSESVDLDGLRVSLVDTAGLRETDDIVESEGVSRSMRAVDVADVVLLVLDVSSERSDEDRGVVARIAERMAGTARGARPVVLVGNKADLPRRWSRGDVVDVSAKTGEGLDRLRARIAVALDVEPLTDLPQMTNIRHIALVERAAAALGRARDAARADGGAMPEEFVLADLQDARVAFEEVTGERTTDDVLAYIFSRFCVGK